MTPKEYVKVLEIQFAVLLNRILFSNESGEMMETIVCEKKQYQAIDLAKLVFAVCVVILHCQILDKSNSFEYVIDKVLLRSAVPFFFVVSGYFFAESFRKNPGGIALKKYILRLLFPLAIFELFNCVVKLVEFTVTGKELDYSIYIIAKSIIGYPLGALWFMKACIIGAIILYPFMKKQKAFIGVLIGLLLYSFALLCNNYYFIIQNTCLDSIIHQYISIFDTARNGLFVGFPLLGLGVLLHDVHKNNRGGGILFALLSLCMLIAEILLTQGESFLDDGSLYVSQLFFIPCLVNLLLNLQCRIPEKTSMICRNLSTGIYLLHRPMMSITFIGFTVVFHTLPSSWMLFAMAIMSSVLICLCAYHYKIPVLERLLK